MVAAVDWDGHGEGDQVQPAPHRLVDVANGGLVVAGDDQLELRHKFEEVLPHEPGRDLVATGQRRPCSVSVAVTRRAPRSPLNLRAISKRRSSRIATKSFPRVGDMLRITPGGRHAWYESSADIIRKPLQALLNAP
jgi:hypothetical protein